MDSGLANLAMSIEIIVDKNKMDDLERQGKRESKYAKKASPSKDAGTTQSYQSSAR